MWGHSGHLWELQWKIPRCNSSANGIVGSAVDVIFRPRQSDHTLRMWSWQKTGIKDKSNKGVSYIIYYPVLYWGGVEVFEVKSLQIPRFILIYSDTAFQTLCPVLQCKHRAETGVAVSRRLPACNAFHFQSRARIETDGSVHTGVHCRIS